MTDLNEKGLRDSLAGLAEVEKAVRNLLARAEQRMAEAEAEVMAARQTQGFIRIHREHLSLRLAAIEAAKETT